MHCRASDKIFQPGLVTFKNLPQSVKKLGTADTSFQNPFITQLVVSNTELGKKALDSNLQVDTLVSDGAYYFAEIVKKRLKRILN